MVWSTLWAVGSAIARFLTMLLRSSLRNLAPPAWRRSLEARRSLKRTTAFAFRSELVVCLRKQQLSLICCRPILGPSALGMETKSPSPPINADWCLLAQTSMALLGAGISSPLARSIPLSHACRCILVPHIGKWSNTPSAKNLSKKFPRKFSPIGKWSRTPSLKRANWVINMPSRALRANEFAFKRF